MAQVAEGGESIRSPRPPAVWGCGGESGRVEAAERWPPDATQRNAPWSTWAITDIERMLFLKSMIWRGAGGRWAEQAAGRRQIHGVDNGWQAGKGWKKEGRRRRRHESAAAVSLPSRG